VSRFKLMSYPEDEVYQATALGGCRRLLAILHKELLISPKGIQLKSTSQCSVRNSVDGRTPWPLESHKREMRLDGRRRERWD
jgi:hypothetical protein